MLTRHQWISLTSATLTILVVSAIWLPLTVNAMFGMAALGVAVMLTATSVYKRLRPSPSVTQILAALEQGGERRPRT